MDMGSLTQSSGKRIYTFLSQAFGLMADLGESARLRSLSPDWHAYVRGRARSGN